MPSTTGHVQQSVSQLVNGSGPVYIYKPTVLSDTSAILDLD